MRPSERFRTTNTKIKTALVNANLAVLRSENDAKTLMIAIHLNSKHTFYTKLLQHLKNPTFPDNTHNNISIQKFTYSTLMQNPVASDPGLNAAAAAFFRAESAFGQPLVLLSRCDPHPVLVPSFDAAVAAGAASKEHAGLVELSVHAEHPAELPLAANIAARRPELSARFREVIAGLTMPQALREETIAALGPA